MGTSNKFKGKSVSVTSNEQNHYEKAFPVTHENGEEQTTAPAVYENLMINFSLNDYSRAIPL